MPRILSVGHGTHTQEELLGKLREFKVTDLVDVRTYPGSKANPQFNRYALGGFLERNGVNYHWRGQNLGGLGKNVDFEKTIAGLLKFAEQAREISKTDNIRNVSAIFARMLEIVDGELKRLRIERKEAEAGAKKKPQ
jgi:uncharacterized protein (DUF488 family)